MAFTPDLGRRRRRAPSRRLRAVFVAFAGLGVAAGLFALVPTMPARADPGTARRELAQGLALFRAGAVTAARDRLREAVRADPQMGLAHAVLARTLLELDDGAAAQAELDRAKQVGLDAGRAHQLYAHAFLLQGDTKRALAAAAKAAPRYAGYAARIRARALAAQGDTKAAWETLAAVVAAYPRDAYAWTDLARLHQSAGDLVAATGSVERAIAVDPRNVDALVLRGELIRDQFGLAGALPWFEAALKRDPADHSALIEYAATLGEAGRYSDMLRATRRALAASPGSPQAYYLQAVLAARAGQEDTARAMMDKTGGALSAMPGALLLGGALDYGAGGWQRAIAQWGDLVGLQPRNIVARRLLAAALLRSGNAAGALDVLRPVAARGDADSYALSLVGRALERDGDRGWAARFLDRASAPGKTEAMPFGSDQSVAILSRAAVASSDPAVAVELVRSLLGSGNDAAALARAEQLVRQNPGTPAAYLLVGDVHAAAARWSDAAASYRQAGDRRFDEPTALRLIDALERAGRRGQAASTLALFLSQNPANVAGQRLAAHWQIADGQWDAAIATLEALRARVGNNDAALLAELAYAFLGKDDADGAEVYAAAAYRLAPSNPAAADAWGWALYSLGDLDRARQLLEKAVLLTPRVATVRWHLAQVYADLGRKAAAAEQARAALADPAFADRAAAQALLTT